MLNNELNQPGLLEGMAKPFSRRKFFRQMGAGTALAVAVSACRKNEHFEHHHEGVDLGSGDIGILNYAYALEQLEAAFYIEVIENPYTKIGSMEMSYLTDIRDHEIAHREFFEAALGSSAIQKIKVDFSTVDFRNRASVLGTAKAFEDLGVTAYNGAGKLISNPAYLTLAGKIVSVEARHAALIRDLILPDSFADMTAVNAMGLDGERSPDEVLAIAGVFIKTKLDASNLPTN